MPTGLAGRVTFTGALPHHQVAEWLARVTVCVYPSKTESLGIAWLEGMAMGKPCVVSATGPGPEVAEDGVSALHVDPNDPQAIARAAVRPLADAPLRERLGVAARAHVLERFSAETLVPGNEACYLRCLNEGTRYDR